MPPHRLPSRCQWLLAGDAALRRPVSQQAAGPASDELAVMAVLAAKAHAVMVSCNQPQMPMRVPIYIYIYITAERMGSVHASPMHSDALADGSRLSTL